MQPDTANKAHKTVFVTRLDIRKVAAIAGFYTTKNIQPRTRSGLIDRIVEDFYAVLREHNLTPVYEDTSTSLAFLEGLGLAFKGENGMLYQKGLVRQIAKESLLQEYGDDTYMKDIVKKTLHEIEGDDDEE